MEAVPLQRVAQPQLPPWLAAVERMTGLTPSGLSVAGLAVLAWIAAYLIGSRLLYLMVYGTVLLLVALALTGRRTLQLEARRSDLPGRVREGQAVSVELTLEGKGRSGTLVLEETLGRLGVPVRMLVASLPAGMSMTHTYAFNTRLRGIYGVGPLVAISSDPFGLTRKRQVLIPPAQIIVHPGTELVADRVVSREWEDPPTRPPISKPWPSGFEFYGMRDYIEGDDPRRIVWRASARTGRILVREAEQGITDRVTIILDTDARTHSPGEPSETFEVAVRAAASLAKMHLANGMVVSVQTSSRVVARGWRGQSAIVRMLDDLARTTVGREDLTAVVRRLITDPSRDTHTILVTPHLTRDAGVMLRLLLDRGGSLTFVHVLTDDTDAASSRRADALGCEVVELRPGTSLTAVFRRTAGAGLRR